MKSEFGKDDKLAVFCARVDHIQQGWRLVKLLDRKGKDSGATLLVRFAISAKKIALVKVASLNLEKKMYRFSY